MLFSAEDRLPDPWSYQTLIELRGFPLLAERETYSGGGYVADLGITEREARALVEKLEQNRWTDEKTRAVIIEFMVLNPPHNLFWSSMTAFEFQPNGGETIPKPNVFLFSMFVGNLHSFLERSLVYHSSQWDLIPVLLKQYVQAPPIPPRLRPFVQIATAVLCSPAHRVQLVCSYRHLLRTQLSSRDTKVTS